MSSCHAGHVIPRISFDPTVLSAAAQGSGHMSFVSTIIGTAERVPLPDVIIRAAIQRLCSRTATRLATATRKATPCLPTKWRRAPSPNTPTRPRPASRGAGGFLRPRARSEPQIFVAAFTRSRPRRCRRPRRRRCARPSSMRISPTGNRSSNSAAAGARCRCGWRGNFRMRRSRRYRIRTRSANISSARPRSAD